MALLRPYSMAIAASLTDQHTLTAGIGTVFVFEPLHQGPSHRSRSIGGLGGIAAAVVFFVLGAGIRLLVGPVSLGPLGNRLSDAIDQALPGITVNYDQAAIEWSREDGKINLVILGAKVFDEDGRIIAQAPKADIDLEAAPLLGGKAVVRRITLVGVQLTLVRTADGALRLGVEKDKKQKDIISRISDAIKRNGHTNSSLRSFAVRHARIAYYDEPIGLFLVAQNADFKLDTAGAGLDLSLDADVDVSGRSARFTGEFVIPSKPGRLKARLR
ncbi:MAG: hypothetical protein WDM89_15810 [Rhizomicrobium sp.]